jgi:hypothetical protein
LSPLHGRDMWVFYLGQIGWFLLTALLRKWLGTGLTLLVLTPVLSHLLALILGFKLQVGGFENIWQRLGVVLRPHPSGVKEEHHFRGRWTRTGDF